MTMRRECAYCLYVRDMADDKAICPSCEQWYARAIWAMQRAAVDGETGPRANESDT